MKKFKRGDLILDRFDGSYNNWTVYLLAKQIEGKAWWVHDFGDLQSKNGWNKFNVQSITLHSFAIKLSLNMLSEEKQKTYREFKKQYIDTDIV